MECSDKILNQQNSPSREFLQSEEWRKFQESVGRKTYSIGGDDFSASIIEHSLPIVGKYFYVPRGPVIPAKAGIQDFGSRISAQGGSAFGGKPGMTNIIELAKKEKVGWIRIEPESEEILDLIKKSTNYKIAKAPHDMQPREILVMDITKSEEELLSGMKQKTRYNIRLAEKKNIKVISHQSSDKGFEKYIDEFIRLVEITAQRDGITPHPENYYRKMFELIPNDIIKLYVAEYEGKNIAANIMIFYGNTCTYLHGASSNNHRELMAPYLLQWRAMQDAKAAGYEKYDFGGVKSISNSPNKIPNSKFQITNNFQNSKFPATAGSRQGGDKIQNSASDSWQGITKFKTGFAPETKSVEFPGSYDIVLNPIKYFLYTKIQKIKGMIA
jgi:peptidoglycan pentaglycine glycine transferase (the first glycine)